MKHNPYVKAAKLLDKLPAIHYNCMCEALFDSGVTNRFNVTDLFKPANAHYLSYWGVLWSNDPEEVKRCRVLALCFLAAMYETGDLGQL